MLLIVAHHYVVLSGLNSSNGPMVADIFAPNSLFLYLFGMWGKTAINCFLMITGYFMCTSDITIRKFLKLYLWVMVYQIAITAVFLLKGSESLSPMLLLRLLPFTNIHSDSFTSAFMAWWLFIPFLNVLVNNISKRQHLLLIGLMILIFTIYPCVPKILHIDVNPICWFSTIYFIASYIRKYSDSIYKSSSTEFWGWITTLLIFLSMASVIAILWVNEYFSTSLPPYYMVSGSNHPFALLVAVSSFIWFKNFSIGYSKWINILGGASFGVLLIHSGSRAMMNWLWKDTVDCVGHYDLPLWQLIGYSVSVVLLILFVCTVIDYTRLKLLEEPFFKWFDKKQEAKTISLLSEDK